MSKTRVLILDYQAIVRIGLRSLLDERGSFDLVGEAKDIDTMKRQVEELHPDILIADWYHLHCTPAELIAAARNVFPSLRILLYTTDQTEESFLQAYHAGADGYVLKDTDAIVLIDALNRVNAGDMYFGAKIAELMLKRFLTKSPQQPVAEPRGLPGNLTKREIEVLRLIAGGMTNNEIAEKLFISAHTVHAHRTNLLKKLGAQGTAQLVRIAIEHGLVSPDRDARLF